MYILVCFIYFEALKVKLTEISLWAQTKFNSNSLSVFNSINIIYFYHIPIMCAFREDNYLIFFK